MWWKAGLMLIATVAIYWLASEWAERLLERDIRDIRELSRPRVEGEDDET